MKILKFYSEGFKRLKVVEITPDGNIQIVSGANEAGKSSVLDAIWSVLCWRQASKNIPNPVNNDKNKAIIELDLGEYIVTRIFGNSGETTQLKITRPNGDQVNSPQKILDGIVGDLSFDPLKFSRENEDKQREILANTINLDLATFDKKRKQAYDDRTEANREKDKLKGILLSLRPPTNEDPIEEKSVSEIGEQLQKSLNNEKEINRLRGIIAYDEEELKKIQVRIQENKKLLEAAESINMESPVSLMTSLQEIEKLNRRAREVKQYTAAKKQLDEIEDNIKKLNAAMELIDIEKNEALENAKLPIDGLSLTEHGIIVNNVPWRQLSQAQKIKYAMAIAMANNPKLKVILISDGSLLDKQSMEVITHMATENNFQVWIEIVDESGKVGVYLENGMIKNQLV